MVSSGHQKSILAVLLFGSLPLTSLVNSNSVDTDASQTVLGCGDSLSELYLSKIMGANVNNFAPSAYFRGSATKFISSKQGETRLDSSELCVDGDTSYSGPIQLYDDGTHGDDFANDGVYSRDCVHFCEDIVDLRDYFGFAMESWLYDTRLIVVDESIEGTVPYDIVDTPLTPDATAIASSHAFFFADINRIYHPDFPMSLEPNRSSGPSGRAVGVSALLQVFGDAFDFVTITPLERSKGAIEGAGIYKWQHWDRRGGPMINNNVGKMDKCGMAVSGVPVYRLTGVIGNGDVVQETTSQNHELVHGVSGYSYNAKLDSARVGDNMHVPGACTFDHSSLQGPAWDWVRGFPHAIPASDPSNRNGIRIEPNDDCKDCSNANLANCCSFRYMDVPNTKDKMLANPELSTLSPLMLYIAGIIKFNEVPNDMKTYYCMGSDVDGGCGTGDEKDFSSLDDWSGMSSEYEFLSNLTSSAKKLPECVYTVDDSDRSKVTSDYVSRFTFNQLVNANGGKRFPEEKFKIVRHAAIHISSRLPSEAEIAFYTLLWRHHETEVEPWKRLKDGKPPIEPWSFHTSGESILYSRLHGIDCGTGGANVPSCTGGKGDAAACAGSPCGPGAVCKDMDGTPFCMCREGLVGDGVECAFPSETSYGSLPNAHELSAGGADFCFPEDGDWTKFTPESSLPPYPGGQAPYSSTSCASNVCPVGWRCNKNKGKCLKPTGSSICEQATGLSKGQCLALGCCKWKNGQCVRKQRNNSCPKPLDPNRFHCDDINTCCYLDCDRLELDSETQIGQKGNCGYNCTVGIAPDINGVVHPELFLWPNHYYTNGVAYGYDKGPLNVQGDDKNMFHRCYNQCYTESPSQKYLHKIMPNETLQIKKCGWLATRKRKTKRKVCTGGAYNLSTRGYKAARIACPDTCAEFLE